MLELREKFVQVVPFVMAEFDEADATFHEPPGEQAFAPELGGQLPVKPVKILRRLGFLGEIEKLGHRRLHAEREFVILDRRLDFIHFAEALDITFSVSFWWATPALYPALALIDWMKRLRGLTR